MLINGIKIANKINKITAAKVAALRSRGVYPKLAVVLVGNDRPSQTYVRKKGEMAKKLGIDFELFTLPAEISKSGLIEKITRVQAQSKISGLIVQLPLPEPLYTPAVLNAIKPGIDVDCLTDCNMGKLVMNTSAILPPTAGAILEILRALKIDLAGKNIVIIGAGALVGKPASIIMMNQLATVTACNIATKNIKEKCLKADIIISGVGKKNLITSDMVPAGAIVIDAGICYEGKKMYGDVNVAAVAPKASFLTPTPGGVGPITVAMLLRNVVICAEQNTF